MHGIQLIQKCLNSYLYITVFSQSIKNGLKRINRVIVKDDDHLSDPHYFSKMVSSETPINTGKSEKRSFPK